MIAYIDKHRLQTGKTPARFQTPDKEVEHDLK